MDAKQGRLNTAKRRIAAQSPSLGDNIYSLYYESSEDQTNHESCRTWKKIKPEEKEQQLISEYYHPSSIELFLLSEVDTWDSNQQSSSNEKRIANADVIFPIRKDHFIISTQSEIFTFHEPNATSDSEDELELSNFESEHRIEEKQTCLECSVDSQESFWSSQSQDFNKENIENSQDFFSSRKNVYERKFDFNASFNHNKHITDILELVEQQHNCFGRKWNEYGIRKAIGALKSHPKRIKSGEEALHIKGIGKSIADKIDIILNTGTLPQITNDIYYSTISLFNKIWGVGIFTSKKLWSKGFRTLEDLRERGANELNKQQKIGLQFIEEFNEKIKREEVWLHGEVVKKIAIRLEPALHVELGGSYRRGRSECGDIDIIITHTKSRAPVGVLHRLVEELKRLKYITDDLEMTEKNAEYNWDHHFDKYLGVVQLPNGKHRRIDIIMVPMQSAVITFIYFTGSKYFNRSMRAKAKKIGFYICNHALSRANAQGKRIEGTIISVKNEKEVFDILGMEYKTPEERDW